jgi:hypothetical protein
MLTLPAGCWARRMSFYVCRSMYVVLCMSFYVCRSMYVVLGRQAGRHAMRHAESRLPAGCD